MSLNIAVSVISKVRSCGSMPASWISAHDLVDEARLLELERERLTLNWSDSRPGRRCHSTTCRARRLEDRPAEGEDRPVSSAIRDELGRIDLPRVGWFQRTRASTPTIRPLVSDDDRLVGDGQVAAARRLGRSSDVSAWRSTIELCMVGSKTCARRLPSALAWYIATSARAAPR